uniref:FecR domain-containing protein n=1 Tax=Roseihalotalea indica TaxID=2867963 RepID=A0AA49GT48_9BACT|nr:FecR domain-containing protein [Tunicatimonas sp. TK19036]
MTNHKLLQKYLNGQCTAEEKQQLYRNLLESEEQDYDKVLNALWEELSEVPDPERATSERMYQAISHHIQSPSSRQVSPVWYRRVAASLIGILLVSGIWYYWSSQSTQVYQTRYGEVKTLVLPDSSVVHLNANSKLTYAPSLGTDSVREVWLTGEAYFEVTHQTIAVSDDPVKLIVHTAQVDIEVIGTAFNVKDRRGITQVVLDEGKVRLKKLRGEETLLAMKPGESVQVDQQQSYSVASVDVSEQVSSWKENELYFNNQSLEEIQQVLADNYGIRLRLANPALRELRFTGSAPADDPSVLFTTLEKSFSLKITHEHDEYIARPKRQE